MANDELDLFKEIIPAIDMGYRDLYDAASDVGRKDIQRDLWNLNRYISSVNGNFQKTAKAIFKVNEYYNKNWTLFKAHPKLQWQLLCSSGNTGSKEFHPWIKLERKKDTTDKSIKLLLQIYPTMKHDEASLLARISTKKEIKQLAKDHGYEDIDI